MRDERAVALQDLIGGWMDAEAQKLRDPAPRALGRVLARKDMTDLYVAEWQRLRRMPAA
jgi:hypothetical protein